MEDIKFEWDESKNKTNQKKHGISFEEAQTTFFDEFARLISDPGHSDSEDRFILLGLSSELRVLVVSHVYRVPGSVIRIISARKANSQERKSYRNFLS